MSIRSQDLDQNGALLFAAGSSTKAAALSSAGTPVYHLPAGDEDSGEERGSTLGSDNDDVILAGLQSIVQGAAKNIASLGDEGTAPSDDANAIAGTSAANGASATSSDFNPMLLPPGYGGAIVAAFLSMIEYLNQMAQQGYAVTQASAQAMIGTNGQKGLIQSWVDAGVASAEAQGRQLMDEAIGQLVTAAVCAATVSLTVGGFAKNCTDGVGTGKLQTTRGQINADLEDVQGYRNLLDKPPEANRVAEADSEKVELRGEKIERLRREAAEPDAEAKQKAADEEHKVELDQAAARRKKELLQGVNLKYKGADKKTGEFSEADKATELAVQHMSPEDRITAKEKVDKQIESLQSQSNHYDTKQSNWTQFLTAVNQAGQAGGQAYAKVEESGDAVETGKEKAQADALSQASQTTEDVKGKARNQQQQDIEAMGQMAQAMAQALASQVQARA